MGLATPVGAAFRKLGPDVRVDREERRDGRRAQERRHADAERAQARQRREQRRVRRAGPLRRHVQPELVRGEGDVHQRELLERAPGGDCAEEVVRCGGDNLGGAVGAC